MKKISFILSALLLGACLEKGEEKKDTTAIPSGFKLGIVVSSDDPQIYFDRTANGAAREFIKQHPEMQISFKNANDVFEDQKNQIKAELDNGVQALFLHIGNITPEQTREIVNMVCSAKVPAVYHNVNPGDKLLAGCPIAYYVGSDYADIGITQGLAVLENWRANPAWDKNGDGSIQYAATCFTKEWTPGAERMDWSVNTLKRYPELASEAEELFNAYPGFQQTADDIKTIVESWETNTRFAELDLILSCSDALSENFVKVLKEKNMRIPLFSMEGSEWAKDAVNKADIAHTTHFQLEEEVTAGINLAINMALERDLNTNFPYMITDKKVRIGAKK